MDCGVQYPPCAMDFDHVRGVKIASISHMRNKNFPVEKIEAEIEKCDVVCANCHRVRTWMKDEVQTSTVGGEEEG